MKTNSILAGLFGDMFGNDSGAGIAVAIAPQIMPLCIKLVEDIALFSLCGVIISSIGYAVPLLRDVEKTILD